MTRYEEVATILRERIEHGIYRVGDRLPSIRAVCQELDVSISTAQEAYRQLMDVALIESRPKSGYFVLPSRAPAVLPSVSRPAQRPLDVSQWDQVLELVATQRDDERLLLGRGVPNFEYETLRPLSKILAGLHRSNDLPLPRAACCIRMTL